MIREEGVPEDSAESEVLNGVIEDTTELALKCGGANHMAEAPGSAPSIRQKLEPGNEGRRRNPTFEKKESLSNPKYHNAWRNCESPTKSAGPELVPELNIVRGLLIDNLNDFALKLLMPSLSVGSHQFSIVELKDAYLRVQGTELGKSVKNIDDKCVVVPGIMTAIGDTCNFMLLARELEVRGH